MMTPGNDSTQVPAAACATPSRRPRLWVRLLLALLLALAAASATWLSFKPTTLNEIAAEFPGAPDAHAVVVQTHVEDRATPERLEVVEQKIKQLTGQLDSLTHRLDSMSRNPGTDVAAPGATSPMATEEINHLKSDVRNLSDALSAVQTQMNQSSAAQIQGRNGTQTSVAVVAAFAQLRGVAVGSASFAHETLVLRRVAGGDRTLGAAVGPELDKIEPLAAAGVPSLSELRENFLALMPEATAALHQDVAQSWRERVIAALQGLITIRPLHPRVGAGGTLEVLAAALAHGQLDAALEQAKALPDSAQVVLKDWRAGAEARLTLDNALAALAERLSASPSAGDDAAAPAVKEP